MLIGLNEILDLADGFAVPAFNTYNMETVMGVIEAAEECGAPVIIQAYSRLFASKEAYYLSPIVLAAAEKASVPVCFHLDHGAGELEVTRAIRYGCTGIMFDGSALPLQENIEKTKKIVTTCSYAGIGCEGELGPYWLNCGQRYERIYRCQGSGAICKGNRRHCACHYGRNGARQVSKGAQARYPPD